MIQNIIIAALVILGSIATLGGVALFLFDDFRADDDMLALAPNPVSAPLVQRRRFESQESYWIRLKRAEYQKMLEDIDESLERTNKSLERTNENTREIKRMLSEMSPAS